MKITSIKTHRVTSKDKNLIMILDIYIDSLQEKSVVVITSKIVSICEGCLVDKDEYDKRELIKREADYYLPPEENRYGMTLTIRDNLLLPTAGIDESNGNGCYILWPRDPQKTANLVRVYLCKRFNLKKVGVLITDSKTSPLRWGTTGIGIAHSGFVALNDYIGKRDIFGRELKMTKANVMDGLAVAAVLVMGEGSEQTPIAIVEDVPFVRFQGRDPSKKELEDFAIDMENDIYGSLLMGVEWKRGAEYSL